MIALYIFLGYIALIVWAWKSDAKKDRKQKADCEEGSREWLAVQAICSKYKVRVITKSNEILESKPFEPVSYINDYGFGYRVHSETSLERADRFIEQSIKFGRYYHEELNLYIPICEIKSMSADTDGE